MNKEIISSEKIPEAIGSYSPVVKVGKFIFISGQLPIEPESRNLAKADQANFRKPNRNLRIVFP